MCLYMRQIFCLRDKRFYNYLPYSLYHIHTDKRLEVCCMFILIISWERCEAAGLELTTARCSILTNPVKTEIIVRGGGAVVRLSTPRKIMQIKRMILLERGGGVKTELKLKLLFGRSTIMFVVDLNYSPIRNSYFFISQCIFRLKNAKELWNGQ